MDSSDWGTFLLPYCTRKLDHIGTGSLAVANKHTEDALLVVYTEPRNFQSEKGVI